MAAVSTPRKAGTRPARGRRPLPQGTSMYTPGSDGTRRGGVERASAPVLVFLHQTPRWLFPALITVAFVVGLAVPGAIGAAALVLVAALLSLLAFMSWPALAPSGRLMRSAAIVVMLALAAMQAVR